MNCPDCGVEIKDAVRYSRNNVICPNCGDLVIMPGGANMGYDLLDVIRSKTTRTCFSYYDSRDPACCRCVVKAGCIDAFKSSRPTCYGEFDGDNEECRLCIDAGQCIENQKMEDDKMSRRKDVVVRRQRRVHVPMKHSVEDSVEDSVKEPAEGIAGDYTEWSLKALRDELELRELDSTGRKSQMIMRLLEDDKEDVEGVEEDVEGVEEDVDERPQVVVRKYIDVKDVPQRVKESQAVQEPNNIDAIVDAVIARLVERLAGSGTAAPYAPPIYDVKGLRGKAGEREEPARTILTYPKVAKTISRDTSVEEDTVAKKGLRGKAWEREVYTPEYFDWYYKDAGNGKPWGSMSKEEKYALADEMGVEWDGHKHPLTDNLRMTMAFQAMLNIEKYKKEYTTKAAREALR